MSYTRKVVSGVAVLFAFTLVANVLGYLLRMYLGRALTTSEFGLVYAVFSLYGLVGIIVYLGFSEAAVKFISDYRAKSQHQRAAQTAVSILIVELVLSFLTVGAISLLAERLAAGYFHGAAAALPLRWYGLAIAIMPLQTTLAVLYQAYQKPLAYSSMSLAQAIALLLSTIGLLTFLPRLGTNAALIPYPFVSLLLIIGAAFMLRRIIPEIPPVRWRIDWGLLKPLLLYSIPVALTTLSWSVISFTDTLVITYYRSLSEVGLYNAALPIAGLMIFLSSSVTTVFLPVVAELWSTHKRALLRGALGDAYLLLAAGIIPIGLILVAFPDVVINVLFGGQFVPAATALRLLALSGIASTFVLFNGAVLAGIGKPMHMTIAVALGAALNLVGDLLLVPRIGFVGAGYATFIANSLMCAVSVALLRRQIRLRIPWRRLLGVALAGVVLLVITIALRGAVSLPPFQKVAFVSIIALCGYAVTLIATRSLLPRDIARLFQR